MFGLCRFEVQASDTKWPAVGIVDSFWEQMTSKPVMKEKLESNLHHWFAKNQGFVEMDVKHRLVQENFLKLRQCMQFTSCWIVGILFVHKLKIYFKWPNLKIFVL